MTDVLTTRWTDGAPPLGDALVVVAPHPDDEVIAAAGLMSWCTSVGVPVRVVAVTDGEMSHARSLRITPDEVRVRRIAERAAALLVLGLAPAVDRLCVPDGQIGRHERRLADAIAELAPAGATVVAPWRHDRHPDHEATGRAAAVAARRTGATLWEVPIWAKVARTVAPGPGRRHSQLVLEPAMVGLKARSVGCFGSQLTAVGPDPLDGPVVHPHELAAMLDGHEAVLWR
ncbi:MAG: PIG-L family deacetylase [Acidimicrobiales bacterium]